MAAEDQVIILAEENKLLVEKLKIAEVKKEKIDELSQEVLNLKAQ